MGTRADFYVGKGPNAEWLGSTAMDGYPEGIFHKDNLRLSTHAEGLPADYFVWLSIPREAQTPGQVACGRGALTVWTGILPELRRRGARIFTDTMGEMP